MSQNGFGVNNMQWLMCHKTKLKQNKSIPRVLYTYLHQTFSWWDIVTKMSVVLWLSSQEMDTATRVQILDETDCISHGINTLREGMNPLILPQAMGK